VGLITRQAEFKECDVKTSSFSVTSPGQHSPAENQHVFYSMFGALQQDQHGSNGHTPPKESPVLGTPREHPSALHPSRGVWPGARCLIRFMQTTWALELELSCRWRFPPPSSHCVLGMEQLQESG